MNWNINISLLHSQLKLSSGFDDFYPIYKNIKKFNQLGICIKIFSSHYSKKIFESDIIILHSRYYFKTDNEKFTFYQKVNDLRIKFILFDGFDTSGVPNFYDYKHFDCVLKKQILKDKSFYKCDFGIKSIRPWIVDEKISEVKYNVATDEDLQKLKLGWNIGILNYNKSKIPILNRFNNFNKTSYKVITNIKKYDWAFRGEINYTDNLVSNQRNSIFSILNLLNNKNSITGKRVSYFQYLNELSESRLSISPFGWGEICYRDFETIFCKTVLIKPNMSHLETFPNLFLEYETYIPVSWDLDDLVEKISFCLNEKNKNLLAEITNNSLNLLTKIHDDEEVFINHFLKSVL